MTGSAALTVYARPACNGRDRGPGACLIGMDAVEAAGRVLATSDPSAVRSLTPPSTPGSRAASRALGILLHLGRDGRGALSGDGILGDPLVAGKPALQLLDHPILGDRDDG